MSKIVVGIDPDQEKNGVAIFINGKLAELHMYNNMEIFANILLKYPKEDLLFSIENVCTTNTIFGKHLTKNAKVDMEIARKVGRNQQAQKELERMLEYYEIRFKRYKPASDWKKQTKTFQLATGWKGRSNEDTRSAAFFGMLAIK